MSARTMLTGRRAQLALLTLTATAAVFARTALGPLQEAVRLQLALTDDQIALIQGPALVFPALMLGWVIGYLVDHRPRVHLVLCLAVFGGIGSACTAVASGFFSLFVARTLVGLSSYGIPVAAASLISDLYERHQRGRANTILAVGEIAGMAAAFGLGGAILQVAGGWTDGWRTAMWWVTVPIAVAPLAALLLQEPERSERRTDSPSVMTAFRELWEYRGVFGSLLAGLAMVGVGDGAALVWVAPTLSRRFHLAFGHVGELIAMGMFIGGTLGPVIGGTLADLCQRKGGPARTLTVLSALAFASALSASFGVAPGVAPVAILLTGFLTMGGAINVAVMAALTTAIPNELRGIAVSVSVTASLLLGFGLAPISVSLLSGLMGGRVMIGHALALSCGATSTMAAVAFALGARQAAKSGRAGELPSEVTYG